MNKHLRMVREIVDWVEINLDENLNVKKIASDFQVSPWHFQRTFKSMVGSSLGEYIRGRRLSHAAEQLLKSNDGILEVGMGVGFGSHEAFTRSFKGLFEMSPKEFRDHKPEVVLQKKPLLKDDLIEFLQEDMDLVPEIKVLPKLNLKGYLTTIPSPFNVEQNFCEAVSQTWIRLINEMDLNPETHQGVYYGVNLSPSGEFTETETQYFSCIPDHEALQLGDDQHLETINSQKYAIFTNHSLIEKDVFNKLIDSIYGYWLPKSGYERALGHDIEIFEGRIDFHQPDFTQKYAIPIL